MPRDAYDAVVIGGGFYGATLAVSLSKVVKRVAVVEREPGLLRRASYANQARVHNGYHYPRSILTSLRSRVNYGRFRADYAAAMDESFTMVYAVARRLSKVNAQQFLRFCNRIGAEVAPAPPEIASLFDPLTIEASFVVTECAFDSRRLASIVAERLASTSNVDVFLNTTALRLESLSTGLVKVFCVADGQQLELESRNVFNCTYSAANHLLEASGYAPVALKHELAEIALVEVPAEFEHLGITVMDGPFFSVMPFPASGVHSMSHVRYTPHRTWSDPGTLPHPESQPLHRPPKSNFAHMLWDISRYVPGLSRSRQTESLWEIKTLLPQSEHDDSRPILLHRTEASRVWTILGAKIDGAYDVQDRLQELAVSTSLFQ